MIKQKIENRKQKIENRKQKRYGTYKRHVSPSSLKADFALDDMEEGFEQDFVEELGGGEQEDDDDTDDDTAFGGSTTS